MPPRNARRPRQNKTSLYGWGHNTIPEMYHTGLRNGYGPHFNQWLEQRESVFFVRRDQTRPNELNLANIDMYGYHNQGMANANQFKDMSGLGTYFPNPVVDGPVSLGGPSLNKHTVNGAYNRETVFGSLGIGIDYPLIDTRCSTGGEYSNPISMGGAYIPVPLRFQRAVHGGLALRDAEYMSRTESTVHPADYATLKGNWIKLEGGIYDCLGIRGIDGPASSGESAVSGELWGWGDGMYSGGSTQHSSMRWKTCTPVQCDGHKWLKYPENQQSIHRIWVDSITNGTVINPDGTLGFIGDVSHKAIYTSDPGSHIGLDAMGKPEKERSESWTDISTGCQGSQPAYYGIKASGLYGWGSFNGKDRQCKTGGGSSIEMGRVSGCWPIHRIFLTDNSAASNYSYTISQHQPLFEKVFGGHNNMAAIDSSGHMYLAGAFKNFTYRDPWNGTREIDRFDRLHKFSTPSGYDGFTWYDSTFHATAIIQSGEIYYASERSQTEGDNGNNIVGADVTNFSSSFNMLDNTTAVGHTLPVGAEWTQVMCARTTSGGFNLYGIFAINSSGQVWFRDPDFTEDRRIRPSAGKHNGFSQFLSDGVVPGAQPRLDRKFAHGNFMGLLHAKEYGPYSQHSIAGAKWPHDSAEGLHLPCAEENEAESAKWIQISPDGVVFTKLLQTRNMGGLLVKHFIYASNRGGDGSPAMPVIMGLTDAGEMYMTDNFFNPFVYPMVPPIGDMSDGTKTIQSLTDDDDNWAYAYTASEVTNKYWKASAYWRLGRRFVKVMPLTEDGKGHGGMAGWLGSEHMGTLRYGEKFPICPTWKDALFDSDANMYKHAVGSIDTIGDLDNHDPYWGIHWVNGSLVRTPVGHEAGELMRDNVKVYDGYIAPNAEYGYQTAYDTFSNRDYNTNSSFVKWHNNYRTGLDKGTAGTYGDSVPGQYGMGWTYRWLTMMESRVRYPEHNKNLAWALNRRYVKTDQERPGGMRQKHDAGEMLGVKFKTSQGDLIDTNVHTSVNAVMGYAKEETIVTSDESDSKNGYTYTNNVFTFSRYPGNRRGNIVLRAGNEGLTSGITFKNRTNLVEITPPYGYPANGAEVGGFIGTEPREDGYVQKGGVDFLDDGQSVSSSMDGWEHFAVNRWCDPMEQRGHVNRFWGTK